MYQKYVLALGWHVSLFPSLVVEPAVDFGKGDSMPPTMLFLHSTLVGMQVPPQSLLHCQIMWCWVCCAQIWPT